MESLDQLSRHLHHLGELRAIVGTMKALSAASVGQYERAVTALAEYYATVEHGLQVALRDREAPSPEPAGRNTGHCAAVVFGSDHGLCGRFNEEIGRHAAQHLRTLQSARPCRVLAVGARAAASLEQRGVAVTVQLPLPGSAPAITHLVRQILLDIDTWRGPRDAHRVTLFYHRHAGGRGYHPATVELLPINLRRFHRLEAQPWPSRRLPVHTLPAPALLSGLLRQFLFVSLFRACAESQASEHSGRLAAMRSAERNIDERLAEVRQAFHRARQERITAELLDVVSGFESQRDDAATREETMFHGERA